MAERTTIARPYADAAFEYARDANAMPQWAEMLRLLEGIVVDPRMSEALGSPKLTGDEKASLLLSIAGDRMSGEMRNFVSILVEADRVSLVPEIRQLFDALRDEAEGVAKATIESPIELTPEQVGGITAALERRFGKRIQATLSLNPALIGGARITVGDTVIDGSVQARLDAMTHALHA
jgi:F-type H+-transporting ATPase subunit delta